MTTRAPSRLRREGVFDMADSVTEIYGDLESALAESRARLRSLMQESREAQRDKIAQCLVNYAEKALTTGFDPLGSLKDVLIELRLYLGVKPF